MNRQSSTSMVPQSTLQFPLIYQFTQHGHTPMGGRCHARRFPPQWEQLGFSFLLKDSWRADSWSRDLNRQPFHHWKSCLSQSKSNRVQRGCDFTEESLPESNLHLQQLTVVPYRLLHAICCCSFILVFTPSVSTPVPVSCVHFIYFLYNLGKALELVTLRHDNKRLCLLVNHLSQ